MNIFSIIRKSLYTGLMIFFFVFFMMQEKQTLASIELMYEVNSIDEAKEVAELYQLQLLDYSDFGYAIYQTNTDTSGFEYEKLGFQINGSYQIANNPIFNNTDDDPYYDNQYAIPMMQIDDAWTLEEGDPAYLIAIVDTGIDTNNAEFTNRISLDSYNAVSKTTGLSAIEDTNGHGTNVAGVIGANKNNGEGIAGIVQNSKLLIIKANEADDPLTSDEDESESFKDSTLIEAIRYSTLKGVDVINMSLGGPGYNQLVQNAIDDAHDAGVIIVASSGNDGTNEALYPASYDHVISVGAVESDTSIADYSNFNSFVDISAPGSQIVTTHLDDTYVSSSGTSFSAPQVTGVIALLQSYLPDLTDQQIIDRLYQTTVDKGVVGKDDYYGWGIINAYQAMLLDAITITFETYDASIIDPIEVAKNIPFNVEPPTKDGYAFDGWYLEETFTTPFNMGVDTLAVDTTLYAKFTRLEYTITFVTDGSAVDDKVLYYGDTFTLPISSKEGYTFNGWYLDQAYENKYTNEPVTDNFTLYAKFTKSAYIINFYIDDTLDQKILVNFGDTINLYTPSGDDEFIGWYLEPTFITLYEDDIPTSDLDLYARFNDGRFVVTYYDSNQTSIYLTQYVKNGEDAIVPDGPRKTSTPSFDFEFIGWSHDGLNITSDLSIYPEYEETYDNRSITIRAGLDTIERYSTWEDAGIRIYDELLTYTTIGTIDTSVFGKYEISYQIYYQDEIIDTITRFVHVVDPQVIITLNPDVSTIFVGDTYVDSGAISNVGEVVASGSVDTSKIGTYVITYSVTYQEETYHKSKYVYVLEAPIYESPETLYIMPDKKEWMI